MAARVRVWFDKGVDFPTDEDFRNNLPHISFQSSKWYKAEKIYCAFEIPPLGHMWYIAHMDHDANLLYGWVSLGDPLCSEWGEINPDDLRNVFMVL